MPDEKRDIDCLSAVRQLWDYLDAELDETRMAEVRRHLERCERCLPHAEFGRRFLEAVHDSRRRRLMPAEARQLVMASLAADGFGKS